MLLAFIFSLSVAKVEGSNVKRGNGSFSSCLLEKTCLTLNCTWSSGQCVNFSAESNQIGADNSTKLDGGENVGFKKTIKLRTVLNKHEIVKIAELNFGKRPRIWIAFPKSVGNDLTNRTDPWLNVLIFPMMLFGGEFHIDGQVSESLVENIEKFSLMYNVWKPKVYKPVKIIAEVIADDYRPNNNKLVSTFSAGVDASYSLYKYKRHLNGRKVYDLDKGVFIYGMDVPLGNDRKYGEVFMSTKKMTDDLGVELISVKTNYYMCKGVNFLDEGCAMCSGVLGFFAKTYATTLLSGDGDVRHYHIPYHENPETSTNPISSQYLSSISCKFIIDGYEHSRTQRAGFIKDWKVAMDNLRVCWKWRPFDSNINCGKCEKCVRTKLNFLVVGVSHLTCMPNDFKLEDLVRVKGGYISYPNYYKDIMNFGIKYKSLSAEVIEVLGSIQGHRNVAAKSGKGK